MAIPTLQRIAEDIKSLQDAGLLDIAELNKHLWPVAALKPLETPPKASRIDKARPSINTRITYLPSVVPTKSQGSRDSRDEAISYAAADGGNHTTEYDRGLGSGLQEENEHRSCNREPVGRGAGIHDRDNVPEEGPRGMLRTDSDIAGPGERHSARIARKGKRIVASVHPVVVSDGPRPQRLRDDEGEHNTRDGAAGEREMTDNREDHNRGNAPVDRAYGDYERPIDERSRPPTVYPITLMMQPHARERDSSERGTKRPTSENELQTSLAKVHRSTAMADKSSLAYTPLSSRLCSGLLSKEQWEAEHTNILRAQFRSRWAEKLPNFYAWHNLDRFSRIGNRPDQAPYEELESVMQRVQSIGTSSVQFAFARSVNAWISSPHIAKCAAKHPAHLEEIPGFEAGPFQRFWKAMEICRCAKGFEDMAILLRRKSLVDLIAAYTEVVKHVRLCSAGGKLTLRNGERASAKAREILYSILYPETETRTRMRSCFNYDQQCANSYVKLHKRFGNLGILAMIPTKINEMDFRSTDARFAAFMELLDMVRPELHGPRLMFYGTLIETVASGGVPDASTIQELSVWTCPRPPLRSPDPVDQLLSTPRDSSAEGMFPVEGLYRSAEDKSHLATLSELEREQILTSRSELVLREIQDRLISERVRAVADRSED